MAANAQLILRFLGAAGTVAGSRGRSSAEADDTVSRGRADIETLGHLERLSRRRATCVAIHAVFADDVYAPILAARVLSIDSIAHPFNAISIAPFQAGSGAVLFGLVQDQAVAVAPP